MEIKSLGEYIFIDIHGNNMDKYMTTTYIIVPTWKDRLKERLRSIVRWILRTPHPYIGKNITINSVSCIIKEYDGKTRTITVKESFDDGFITS